MKKRPLAALVLALGVLAVGCGSNGAAVAPTTGPDDLPKLVINDPVAIREWPTDPYQLVSVAITDNTLEAVVRYAGGCEDHVFRLVSSGLRESEPVSVGAFLSHDANGDACEALITETLRFDLAPLSDTYRRVYGAGAGEISFCLKSHDDVSTCEAYTF